MALSRKPQNRLARLEIHIPSTREWKRGSQERRVAHCVPTMDDLAHEVSVTGQGAETRFLEAQKPVKK